MGLFAALQMSGRSLQAFSTGIQVAGQNIANSSTPGYIREEMKVFAMSPYRTGSLVLGTGVQIDGIRQVIDQHLESRVHSAKSDQAATGTRSSVYLQLENIIGELGDQDLSSSISSFLAAAEDLTNEPNDDGYRSQFLTQAGQLTRDFQSLRAQVGDLYDQQNGAVRDLVDEANGLIDQINELNPQISKLEASGLLRSDAGGLRTQRYAALQRLSEIVPITYRNREDGGVDVLLGNDYLLLDGSKQHLETYSEPQDGLQALYVRTSSTKSTIPTDGGQIGGTITGRDQVLNGFLGDLDSLAASVIGQVNTIHSSGEGLIGHRQLTAERAVTDPAATLNATGLPFPVRHGSFEVKLVDSSSGETKTTRIDVDLDGFGGNDTTLNSLAASLGGVANLSATIDPNGRLQLTAADGYELKFSNDTSGTLSALGINTLFTGEDAKNIGVSATIQKDPRLLATGKGGGPGDNATISTIAASLDSASADLGGNSVRGRYESMVVGVGQGSASESAVASGADVYLKSLLSQREQYSGVSLDEEAIRLMEFQHAYQAAARVISTVDEMLQVLMNI